MAANSDDHLQDQDVQVLVKGLNVPVYVDQALQDDGWVGGQWVTYTANSVGRVKNIRVVSVSDGTKASGFLMRGADWHPTSNDSSSPHYHPSEYNFSSYKPRTTGVVTMVLDGSYIFKHYERYAYPNRTSGTALTYTLGQAVYISERGYITTYQDALDAGITAPVLAGYVWLVPSSDSDNRIGIDRT